MKVTFERCALFGESFIGDSSICYTVCGISGQKVKTSYRLYSCPLLESQKNVVWDVLLCSVYSETLYLIFPTGLLSMVLVLPSAHAGSYDLHRILETQGKCEHFTPLSCVLS